MAVSALGSQSAPWGRDSATRSVRQGDLELVVSELVNNAFLDGLAICGSPCCSRAAELGATWSTAVTGLADGLRAPTRGGRRLRLGHRGATDVALGVRKGTSHVWFEMDLAAESR